MKPKNILVVEDELIVAKHIEKQLIKAGYSVTALVNNGADAIEVVRNKPTDLILMDVNIEGELDGIETSAIINNQFRVPIVYLTAFTEKNTIDRAKQTDPYGYIIKPFSSKNLETTVEIAYHKFQVEKKLRESESWLFSTIDNMAEAVITTQPDGTIKYLNPIAEKLTSWSNTDAAGNNIADVLTLFEEQTREPVEDTLEKIKDSNNDNYTYVYLKPKTGEDIIIGFKSAIIKRDDDNAAGIVIVFQDFTEQRLDEIKLRISHKNLQEKVIENDREIQDISQNLQISEEKYITFIENVFDLVCEFSVDGSFNSINNSYEKLFSYSISELSGKKIFDFVYEQDLDEFTERFNNAIENISGFSYAYRSNTKSGDYRWLESTAKALINSTGQVVILMVSRDITESKEFEEHRINSDRLESLGVLAGGIAHDFNNLITVVLGNLSLLQLNSERDEEDKSRLDAIEKASKRARDLTLQLLAFSKGGTSNKQLINEVDQIVYDTTRFALSGSKIKYQFSFSDQLWSINADESQLSQVVSNFIINAKQAMPNGGIIMVSLQNTQATEPGSAANEKDYIVLSVQDEGVGIKPENLQKIFDPYFTTKKTGSGLGLATCYNIVKNHGGFIQVDSELNKGTTFHVYLPAVHSGSDNVVNMIESASL